MMDYLHMLMGKKLVTRFPACDWFFREKTQFSHLLTMTYRASLPKKSHHEYYSNGSRGIILYAYFFAMMLLEELKFAFSYFYSS